MPADSLGARRAASPARAAVIGGGLAGISAAAGLADCGWDVTLLESRPRLGGAAYSFNRRGLTVDTGAHVLLRCYTGYRALLRRMEVDALVPVQPRMHIPVLRPGRPATALRRGRLGPARLQLLPTLLRYPALSVRERVGAVRAAAALRTVDPDDPRWDTVTFGDWLADHRQRGRQLTALWELLCVAALNIGPERASMGLAARVLQTALLGDVGAGDIAVPAVPLTDLHDAPARRMLERAGVRCLTGERATAVRQAGSALAVDTAAGSAEVDAVVLAVPHRQASRLVPESAAPDRAAWAGLGASPIVNVHVIYPRTVTGPEITDAGFAAVLDSTVQWVFDRTSAAGVDGQYLVVSLSAADDVIREPTDELSAINRLALAQLFPAAAATPVLDSFITREPNATFRQQVGTAALRPPTGTRWPGLALAGAWTATGWPDTLEGAVRSGSAAVEYLGTADRSERERQVVR